MSVHQREWAWKFLSEKNSIRVSLRESEFSWFKFA